MRFHACGYIRTAAHVHFFMLRYVALRCTCVFLIDTTVGHMESLGSDPPEPPCRTFI